MSIFEHCLTAWFALAMVGGVLIGLAAPDLIDPNSDAALATEGGVLVKVPVMLSLVAIANRTRARFSEPAVQ